MLRRQSAWPSRANRSAAGPIWLPAEEQTWADHRCDGAGAVQDTRKGLGERCIGHGVGCSEVHRARHGAIQEERDRAHLIPHRNPAHPLCSRPISSAQTELECWKHLGERTRVGVAHDSRPQEGGSDPRRCGRSCCCLPGADDLGQEPRTRRRPLVRYSVGRVSVIRVDAKSAVAPARLEAMASLTSGVHRRSPIGSPAR